MPWFNNQLWSSSEMPVVSANALPSEHQVGDDVVIHLFENEDIGPATQVPCKVSSITVGTNNVVQYQLAFQVTKDVWVVNGPYTGYVTKPGQSCGPDGGLIDLEQMLTEAQLAGRKDHP